MPEITGKIENSDYWNYARQINSRNARTFRLLLYVFLPVMPFFLLLYFFFRRPEAPEHIIFLAIFFHYVSFLSFVTLLGKLFQQKSNKMKFHNLGPAKYSVTEKGILFSGTTFSCEIPFTSIIGVVQLGYLNYLEFTHDSAFLLPKSDCLLEGDLDAFCDFVKSKIASQ